MPEPECGCVELRGSTRPTSNIPTDSDRNIGHYWRKSGPTVSAIPTTDASGPRPIIAHHQAPGPPIPRRDPPHQPPLHPTRNPTRTVGNAGFGHNPSHCLTLDHAGLWRSVPLGDGFVGESGSPTCPSDPPPLVLPSWQPAE
jgi:hypothetical protein